MARVKDLSDENIVKALHNMLAEGRGDEICLDEFLESSLSALFYWADSPEGEDYWRHLDTKTK